MLRRHEKAALSALGFDTKGHALTIRGMVADVDAFWVAQNNLDQSLWPVRAGKLRKWQDLWEYVFPKVIERCEDVKELKSCGCHLDEVIRLRKVEYNQKKHLNIASLNRSHLYMLSVINTSKEAVNRQISRLSPSKQTPRRRRNAQQQR